MARERKSRTRAEILAEVTVAKTSRGEECVWVTCHNCGGSGLYPSSMIPAGRCRFYCWRGRTPETFGKLAVPADRYVRRIQARERREWNRAHGIETAADRKARERREAREAEYRERMVERAEEYGRDRDEEFEVELRRRAAETPESRFGEPSFYADLVRQLDEKGWLSETQVDAARAAFERADERARELAEFDAFVTGDEEIPGGRVRDVELQVLAVKRVADRYSYVKGATTRKVMARSRDGWRVWMSHPRFERAEERPYYVSLRRGDVFRVSVTIERKEPDFGFAKRPAKAEAVSLVPREEEAA